MRNASRVTPWRVEHVGSMFRVLDVHNCEVCVVDVCCYPDEAAARSAAETIVFAATVLDDAIGYVDDVGECVFCGYGLAGDYHDDDCSLAGVP